jgi:hypothetical protein
MIKLDQDQINAVDRMVNEPTRAALNASQYGTGKTVVTVEVGQRVAPNGVKLVVAPLFTKYGWQTTISGQYPDQSIKFINSKKSGQQALLDLLAGVPGWYIIGREYFASRRIHSQIAPVSPRIDFLAYDECARWANYKSQGFKMMKQMKPGYRMALSATPGANKFSGLFAITHWLWPKYEGHDSYWKFVADHCETEIDYYAGVIVKGEKEPGSYVSSLPCYVRLEKDFGEPIIERIEIDLSSAERKIYETFERALIVWIKDHPLIAKFPIVKRLRLRQMTLGTVALEIDADGNEKVFFDKDMKSTKYDTLLSYLGVHPEPALILTHSAKYANVVAYQLVRDGYKALPWTGEVPEDLRQAMKLAFEADGGLDYIVATIGSIGEGIDGLQKRARLMIWLSRDDNNMLNEQAFRRLHRRGQERQVVSVDIVARDTYDDGQLSKLVEQAIQMNASLKKGD